MNPVPDYSAAYVVLRTTRRGAEGHGLAFTVGRGNEVQVAAIAALAPMVVGLPVDELLADLGAFCPRDSSATARSAGWARRRASSTWPPAAVVNAVWDLAARRAGKPLWQLLARPHPGAAGRAGRLPLPARRAHRGRGARAAAAARRRPGRAGAARCWRDGYPAYTTTPGLAGLRRREARPAVPRGGRRRLPADQAQGRRRTWPTTSGGWRIARRRGRAGHPHRGGRQPDLGRARRRSSGCGELRPFDPYWIEEPTSPDDVLGHAAVRQARRADPGRHRRARRQRGGVQAAAAGRRRRRGADRRLPGRRRQREPRDPAARREVRRAGLPARRRRRAVRDGAAPGDVRLSSRSAAPPRTGSSSTSTTCTSTSSTRSASAAGATSHPPPRGMSAQILPTSLAEFLFPDGPQWADAGAPAEAPTQ